MDRGDGIGLTIDRTLDATTTFGREAGRQAVRIGRVDQLHGDAVGALLRRRCARLGPARLVERHAQTAAPAVARLRLELAVEVGPATETLEDRKSTRLNSSHLGISYAVFCLNKKKQHA